MHVTRGLKNVLTFLGFWRIIVNAVTHSNCGHLLGCFDSFSVVGVGLIPYPPKGTSRGQWQKSKQYNRRQAVHAECLLTIYKEKIQ